MYFLALAADFDGTIARNGFVDDATSEALKSLKESGRRLILVTGRQLGELADTFLGYGVFDRIVAENGAVVHDPTAKQTTLVCQSPLPGFVAALKARHIEPLSIGDCIVATWEPNEKAVLEIIREQGLGLQISFNKGAVMVLPSGVNKATGLKRALDDLELSPHNVVAVGDAENDFPFLRMCGCAVAVANALPSVKEAADVVLDKPRGDGVRNLVDRICRDDAAIAPGTKRAIRVGQDRDGRAFTIDPEEGCALVAGSSGIGKSTLATALTERMQEAEFQFCVFDPEGDYDDLDHAVSVGGIKEPPNRAQLLKLLHKVDANVVVNTQAISVEDRPPFFAKLFPHFSSLRAETGRPHWLLIDEAHHLLPQRREGLERVLPNDLRAAILITVHPEAVAVEVLDSVKTVFALGEGAADVISCFSRAIGAAPPASFPAFDPEEEVLAYSVRDGRVTPVIPDRPKHMQKRHSRKYAEGQLGEDRSFWFRGPDNALNLRAQNLTIFLQMADGVDDRTWEFHRRAGHYSEWFRTAIKDKGLADEAAGIEQDASFDPRESRSGIREAVLARYTAPVKSDEH
ncbi:HAD family hydrolase [Rhodomicrobium sp. Az07]|uniref:HAD-IIB family hydrolase n=1 Tax=Rhodomicrobium sp. Az07 TaxID=2839034 RepID=UPI001BE7E547|nr:HAD family hydrolase [Rhodomicrobium sp. Az07]